MDPIAFDPGIAPAVAPAGNPASVSINWTLFSGIYGAIDTPLMGGVDAIIGAITGQLTPALKAMFTVYLMWVLYRAMFSNSSNTPIALLVSVGVRCGIIVMLVGNTAGFNQWIGTPLLRDIPTGLGELLNGAMGGGAPINGGSPYDQIWNKSYVAGLTVYDNLPSLSFKGALLAVLVFAFWGLALAFVAVAFLMFLGSHVLLAPVVAVGPLFVACLLFEGSRRFFNGWLSAVTGLVVAQLLVTALLTLMINIENQELAKIASAPAGANELGQLGSLMGVAALLGICAMLTRAIPSIAMTITSGAYHQMTALPAAFAGVVAGGARGVSAGAGAVGQIGSASYRSSGLRGLPPMAARSLSGP